jgi:hypothetical protein
VVFDYTAFLGNGFGCNLIITSDHSDFDTSNLAFLDRSRDSVS